MKYELNRFIVPRLSSSRLTLRPWIKSDVDRLYEMLTDTKSEAWIGIPGVPAKIADAYRLLMTFVGHWQLFGLGKWVIISDGSDAFCGYVGFWKSTEAEPPELAWALHPDSRRRGLATEAATLARKYALKAGLVEAKGVYSIIADGNIDSQRVAERLGMIRAEQAKNPYRPHHYWRSVSCLVEK